MTPFEVASRALPTVQQALVNAQPEIRQAVGPMKWVALWPTWKILTGDLALPILIRVCVELAVGWARPWALPMLNALQPIADRFLTNPTDKQAWSNVYTLLQTPVSVLSEPARMALRRPQ